MPWGYKPIRIKRKKKLKIILYKPKKPIYGPTLYLIYFKIFTKLHHNLFNLNKYLFLRTTRYTYSSYWTLFGYNEESYYTLKNILFPHPNSIFLKITGISQSTESCVNNLVAIKKANADFDSIEPQYTNFVEAFLRSNSEPLNNVFLEREFYYGSEIWEDVEDEETNVWVDNSFKYKTKMMITNQRVRLAKFLGFKLKRHYRITAKISNFLKWKVRNIINFFDLILINVVLSSKLILDFNLAAWLIRHGFVYVNGGCKTEINLFLKPGDVVNLIFSPVYSEFYFYHFNSLFRVNMRVVNKFSRKMADNPEWDIGSYLFRKTKPSKTLKKIALLRQPIPLFLETDFLTYSVYVVYTPFNFYFVLDTTYNHYNYYLARLYNWKFRS